jgi:hypothetical protein
VSMIRPVGQVVAINKQQYRFGIIGGILGIALDWRGPVAGLLRIREVPPCHHPACIRACMHTCTATTGHPHGPEHVCVKVSKAVVQVCHEWHLRGEEALDGLDAAISLVSCHRTI